MLLTIVWSLRPRPPFEQKRSESSANKTTKPVPLGAADSVDLVLRETPPDCGKRNRFASGPGSLQLGPRFMERLEIEKVDEVVRTVILNWVQDDINCDAKFLKCLFGFHHLGHVAAKLGESIRTILAATWPR